MIKKLITWAVVVVKWSACSPSTPTIRVRILQKSTGFCTICVRKERKEAGVGPFKQINYIVVVVVRHVQDLEGDALVVEGLEQEDVALLEDRVSAKHYLALSKVGLANRHLGAML